MKGKTVLEKGQVLPTAESARSGGAEYGQKVSWGQMLMTLNDTPQT
jgi:hypothetical protein